MVAYAGVFRFCFGVVQSCGCCPAPAAATAQRPGSCRPDPGRSRPSSRAEPPQQPLGGGAAAASRPNACCGGRAAAAGGSCLAKRFLACGRTDAATRLPRPSFKVLPRQEPRGCRSSNRRSRAAPAAVPGAATAGAVGEPRTAPARGAVPAIRAGGCRENAGQLPPREG
eukprot:scaffold128983_cov63-Phaeocystis_antarctica.AAC.1